MGLITDDTGTYHMSSMLINNLDTSKAMVKKDWDMVMLVDGEEGSGKSVLTMQMAKYCDPTFNLERVVFKSGEFMNAIRAAKREQAIVFDEAFQGLSSRETMKYQNVAIVKMLAEIRQKNLFIFIVGPSFFDIDRNVAIHRTRCLVHVYADQGTRGLFGFYGRKQKKKLYLLGKKLYDYKTTKPDYRARFVEHYTIPKEQYKAKKLRALGASDIGNTKELLEEIELRLTNKLEKLPAGLLTVKQKAWIVGKHWSNYPALRQRAAEYATSIGNQQPEEGLNNLTENEQPPPGPKKPGRKKKIDIALQRTEATT